jgi:hypothetical protein
MPRFFHIDHNLYDVGGHERDHAENILRAAEDAGYDVVLATHQSLRHAARFPERWRVLPVFPFKSYTKHCVWFGGHDHLPMDLRGRTTKVSNERSAKSIWSSVRQIVEKMKDRGRAWQRRRIIDGFVLGCRRLFEVVPPRTDDHVFFATATEFDLLGLARFFDENAQAKAGNWHIQFHFGVYGGCATDAESRSRRRQAVKQQFEAALRYFPRQSTRFYNTTHQLAEQYNELGVAEFRHLHLAVNPLIQPVAGTSSLDRPLQVTCAGAVRRDKKLRNLKKVVEAVRGDSEFDGKIRFVAQLPQRKRRKFGIREAPTDADPATVRFDPLPHPLDRPDYEKLIHDTDIALFFHDRTRYAAQCSGVLHEMLAAGKPAIVPGGSWLASQISEPIFDHIERLCQDLPTVGHAKSDDLQWRKNGQSQAADDHAEVALGNNETVASLIEIPFEAEEIVVGFRWTPQSAQDQHLHVQLQPVGPIEGSTNSHEHLVNHRWGDGYAFALFHRKGIAEQAVLRLSNYQDEREITIREIQVRFLGRGESNGCPSGSVGLIATSPTQIPSLLSEMTTHFEHYRDSAVAFSHAWRQAHHPSRTVAALTGRETLALGAA